MVLPMVFKRFPQLQIPSYTILFGKHMGTGVIISLALIHLLVPSMESLSSPCLPESFTKYSAWAPLICMFSSFTIMLIENILSEKLATQLSTIIHVTTGHGHGAAAGDHVHSPPPGIITTNSSIITMQPQEATNGTIVVPISHFNTTSSEHGHSHGIVLSLPTDARTVSTYLLEFGCTLHSVIIGITLGIESDAFKTLLIAMVFHQTFEGFALGARLAELKIKGWSEVILIIIYCISTPIGMVIGIATAGSYNPNSERALYTTGFMDAISAGILLYIGFNMIVHDFVHDIKGLGWKKKYGLYFALWFAAGIMAFIGNYL